jgi:hypothetical protein
MCEFLVCGTQAEEKGAEDLCLSINIIDLVSYYVTMGIIITFIAAQYTSDS